MTFTQGALLVCCAGATVTLGASMFLTGGSAQGPVTLSQLTNDQTKDYSGKVGKKYEYFLVNTKGNEKWWEGVYKKLKDENPSDSSNVSEQFKTGEGKIQRGFKELSNVSTSSDAGQQTKALNEVCEEVYKKGTEEADPTASDTTKKQLGKDLFKYCSILGGVPKTAEDHGTETVSHSQITGEKAKLISTSHEDNGTFWTIKDAWFRTLNVEEGNYFKTQAGTGDNRKSLKEVCQEAYKASVTNDTTDPKKDDIIKYCSFDTSGATRSQ